MTLPAGWIIEEGETEGTNALLPEGWAIEGATAPERDYQKMQKAAGPQAVQALSREEYESLSPRQKEQYFEELERQGESALSHQFTTKLLSGLTFGASENIEALKPTEYEEFNPYDVGGATAELLGSSLPLTGLAKVFHGPAVKLATKSPILQQQLASLATMFGIGASESGLRAVAKGEMPSAEDMLTHGFEWALLDGALQAAGAVGSFAKSLLWKSNTTGIPRKDLVNNVYRQIEEAGIDMTQPEKVAQAALEILESPMEAATSELSLPGSKKTPSSELAEKVLQEPPITPKSLRERKISSEYTNRMRDETINLSEPIQPENINATKQMQKIEEEALSELIESSGERAVSQEELGSSIKESLETNLKTEKSAYKPLYEEAQAAAETLVAPAARTGKVAGDKLKEISKYRTKPEGYPKVIERLENVLTDLGFVVQRDSATGEIEQILKVKDAPLTDQIEVGRRLNEIIDFETVEPTVQDVLKGVVKAVKQDIRAGLAANTDALAAFELAEEAHAKTAAKYGKESIRRIRQQRSPERIANQVESPTVFRELKDTLSPQEFSRIEREILEKMNKQNYENSKKTLRELERHMTDNSKQIARDIVESKNPLNTKTKEKLLKNAVVDDLSNAFSTGQRPNKTLDLWQTSRGRKIVRDAFHGSPNWGEVKSYLEHQSFNDMVSSVTKNGKLDRARLKEFMRNEATIQNIRDVGGEEAVSFFKDMDAMSRRLEENANLLKKVPSKEQIQRAQRFDKESIGQKMLERGTSASKKVERATDALGQTMRKQQKELASRKKSERGRSILKRMASKDFPIQASVKEWGEWLKETFGLNEKAALTVFGLMKLGLPNTVVNLVGYRLMNKMLTSNAARRAFKEAARRHTDPLTFLLAIEEMGKAFDEE